DRAGASSAPAATVVQSAPALSDLLALQMDSMTGGNIFAKYDGVDGESDDANHSKWIDVLSVEWGAQLPDNAANSAARGGWGYHTDR
ncbi:MAG: type VI secretion system tube protein Hcp, partial [Acidimicrobiia bacterium]